MVETNIYNNEARSNYTRFVSASASPSSRAVGRVALANPFEESAIVNAVVRQTHRLHRVYIDHTWLRVPAGQSRTVQVFDEALYGFPEADLFGDDIREELWGEDNKVSIEGWAERPFPADCGAPTLTGGAGISVGAGRAVAVELEDVGLSFASGTVRYLDGSAGEPDGRVLVVARECDEEGAVDPIGDRVSIDVDVRNGRFATEFRRTLDADFGLVQAHFLGDFGAAPAESEPRVAHG